MEKFKEIFNIFLQVSEEERIAAATKATNFILTELNQTVNDAEAAVKVLLLAISTFVCADGIVNQAEYKFVKSYTGLEISFDDFFEIMKGGLDQELINDFDYILDNASLEFKQNMLVIGACICAANGQITTKEQNLIIKLAE